MDRQPAPANNDGSKAPAENRRMEWNRAGSSRIPAALRAAILVLLAVAAGGHGAPAAEIQRMAVAPGCYVLAPGQFYDVSAYCLDQSRAPPPLGAILSYVPADFDAAAIKPAGGAPMTLSEALTRGVVRIEGLGNRDRLRIANLTGGTVEICVTGPTVLIGNGETYAGDLEKIRGRLAGLLGSGGKAGADPGNGGAGPKTSANVQRKLWDAVNAADRAETEELSHLFPVAPFALPDALPAAMSARTKCVGDATSAKVCLE